MIIVISLLAGAVVITITYPPLVVGIAVCGVCFTTAIVTQAMGKL